MSKRSAIRWPWRRTPNRLGLGKGGRAPARPERRTRRLAVIPLAILIPSVSPSAEAMS